MKYLAVILLAGTLAACSHTPMTIDKQVNKLYEKMTQQERIAQLRATYVNDYFNADGTLNEDKCKAELSHGIGHFSQYASQMSAAPNAIRDRVAVMQQWLIENTPSGIPALFHEEVLTGVCTRDATVYPQQIGLACSFNTALAEEKALQTGIALRKMGGLLSLSPMVDVVRNHTFNRIEESYGEDAYLSAILGTAFVKGLQQGDLRKGVGTCSKHFLGYGGGGDADEKELMEEILLPHETMIRLGGNKVIMTGYHAVKGTKAVANSYLQKEILRDYLHFDGMMVSDYGSIDQIPEVSDPMMRGVLAINAGNDVDFPRGRSYAHLQRAMDMGLVSQQTFEKAVKDVLTYKARVGLLDKKTVLYSNADITFDSDEERQTAYKLATQSVVLLKNDSTGNGNTLLPLKTENGSKTIFLTGPNANSMWAMLGDYTFHSMRFFWQRQTEDDMHPKIVGLKEGMEVRKPAGMTLTYNRGCEWTEEVETIIEAGGDARANHRNNRMVKHHEEADMNTALQMAAQSDVIIAAMGENVMLCGENRDRSHMYLPGKQEEYVERLLATGKPVVLIVFGGRAQVISRIADRCAAIIQAWYPGEEGGNALADILYGNVSPSGKLCVSYPNTVMEESYCYNRSIDDDARIAWPFGYGLGYTTFEYSNMYVASDVSTANETVTVSFNITNTGNTEADEVAQIYLSPTQENQHIRPIQLQGFERVTLKPGETKTVTKRLAIEQFGYYADKQWHVMPGTYNIKVGASSRDILLEKNVTLTGDAVTKALRDRYFAE